MNVSLSPELERQVVKRVESGLYTSASEVIREALRLFLQFERLRAQELDLIHGRIAEGLAQLDRGEGIPGDEAMAITRRNAARRRAARSGTSPQ